MKNKKFFSSKNVTMTAVLLALVIVLQAFGGSISIGVAQLNFTLIPIVLGAIVLGPLIGAVLGLACGIVVLIQVVLGLAPFYVLIWTNDPIVTTLTCLVKTTLAGWVSGIVFQILKKKNETMAVFVASGIVPVINTAVFVLGCMFMTGSVYAMAGSENVLSVLGFVLVSIVTFNFFIEFAINLLLAPALHTVYSVVVKRIRRK